MYFLVTGWQRITSVTIFQNLYPIFDQIGFTQGEIFIYMVFLTQNELIASFEEN